jgi:hypothetical protein
MTEKEQYIDGRISKLTSIRLEMGGNEVCPYASSSKLLIQETPIDSIAPLPGYDVIVFIVEDFWRLAEINKWVRIYNEKYSYYKFFADTTSSESFIRGIPTDGGKYNLILAQSKAKIRSFRKKLEETGYYHYWNDEYLNEVLGEDKELYKLDERPG